jgi:hypothetical protein
MTVKKVKQWKYKPPVHKPEDHVYDTLNKRVAEIEEAKAERKLREAKAERRARKARAIEDWIGETFQWLIYLAFFAFLVTSCVQGDFKKGETEKCDFMYRGSCNG